MAILLPFDFFISKDVFSNGDQWKEVKFILAILAKVWMGRGLKLLATISTECMILNRVVFQ